MNPKGKEQDNTTSTSSEGAGRTAGAAQEHSAASGDAADAPKESQTRNPVGRLAGESRALFEDLREWVDLRVQLVQVDVEERIEKAANEIIAIVMVVILALFALAFLLHGLAIWLGEVLGGAQWGYLIIAAILAITTLALRTVKPGFVQRGREATDGKKDSLPEAGAVKATLPPATKPGVDNATETKKAGDQKEGDGNV